MIDLAWSFPESLLFSLRGCTSSFSSPRHSSPHLINSDGRPSPPSLMPVFRDLDCRLATGIRYGGACRGIKWTGRRPSVSLLENLTTKCFARMHPPSRLSRFEPKTEFFWGNADWLFFPSVLPRNLPDCSDPPARSKPGVHQRLGHQEEGRVVAARAR